ncbi:hypothetical protein PFISCL1PPCAC_28593, partial [Pristionchus fissidentatus]
FSNAQVASAMELVDLKEILASVLYAFLSARELEAAIYPTMGRFQKAAIRATASISALQYGPMNAL